MSDDQNTPQQQGDGLPLDDVRDARTGPPPTDDGGATPAARAASVQLRQRGAEQDAAELMDPANQSLAEALQITYRLVQAAMVILAVLFLFSGFQRVDEGERGIKVRFGKPVASDLDPGPQFAWPYPIGELVKVGTGNVSLRIDEAFWPETSDPSQDVDQLTPSPRLNPAHGRDGSVITADLNLAHTQWQAVYRREDTVRFVENVAPGEEQPLVRAALERGVVRAVAETTIDELLKPQGDSLALARRAREIAQQVLDATESGIVIEQLESLQRPTPPIRLRDRFNRVLSARSTAQTEITGAESARTEILTRLAGPAAETVIELIDRYELAVETGRSERASVILSTLDRLLEGEPVELEGVTLAAADGEVIEIIQDARVERQTMVQEARGDLELYKATLAQFDASPLLTVQRNWRRAWGEFSAADNVVINFVPRGASGELLLNIDPDIVKALDREAKARQQAETIEERDRLRRQERFRTERGIERDEDEL